MNSNITLKSLKGRYEEAIARGDRIDRIDERSKPYHAVPTLNMNNDKSNDGFFLTQKAAIRNQTRREIDDLEQLLSSSTQTSQSTLLLKKRKEMKEVDDALELMKKDHKKRMDMCEERRIQFESKQAKLREQVWKFEKFIQENDLKRQRAETKAKYEKKQYEEKCKEIVALMATIQELETTCQQLQKQLTKEKKYEEYLEKITDQGDYGYEEILDILNRHRTLVGANQDLMVTSSEREKDLDILRTKLHGMKTEKQNQLLVSNSSIQAYQNQLEQMRSAVKVEEEEKYHMEDKQKNVSKELSQVMLAIKNIFNRCIITMHTQKSSLVSSSSAMLVTTGGIGSGTVPTLGSNMFHSSSSVAFPEGTSLFGTNNTNMSTMNLVTMTNKALIQLSEKLDQSLAVIHERMMDLQEIIREYPASGYNTMGTNLATNTGSNTLTRSNSNAIAAGGSKVGGQSNSLKESSVSTTSNAQSRSQHI